MKSTPGEPTILAENVRGPSRRFVLAGGVMFGVSTAFPIVAGVLREDQLASWLGPVDVVLAFATVCVGALIGTRARRAYDSSVLATSCGIYRALANLLLVLLVLFFLAGDRIRWHVLLPGLAWRGWLLAFVLPAAIAAWKADGRSFRSAYEQR
jgi:hypothetical protein